MKPDILKNINIWLISGIILLLCSCDDWLNVSPKSQVKDTDHFSSESGFKKELAGVYSALTTDSLYGKEMTYGLVDVLAQVWTNSEGERYKETKLYNYEDSFTKGKITQIWAGMYNAIANANIILEQIDQKKEIFTGNNYAIIKGEALALRAYMHFDLLRLYGAAFSVSPEKKAIPYVKSYTEKVFPQLTVEQVAEKVIEDLLAAKELLKVDPIFTGETIIINDDDGYLMNRQVHLNYYAVTGLLARIYLYMGNNEQARLCAKEVIESEKFSWVKQNDLTGSDLASRDLTFASEHLFALNVVKLGTLADKYFKQAAGGYYYNLTTARQLEYFPKSSDYRGTYLFATDNGVLLYIKYWQLSNNSYYRYKLPLIRMSEMYLILAEIYKDGDTELANQYIDALTQARGLGKVSVNTGFNINDEIFYEYRREFLAEGQLFFYYKRKNRQTVPNAEFSPVEKNGYILPLPDVEYEFGNREANR